MYTNTSKGWMKREVFDEYLLWVYSYIGQTVMRRVALLIDNAYCRGKIGTIPNLASTEGIFLPKNTTLLIQPLDAGVIPCIEKRFRRHKLNIGLQTMDIGELDNIYTYNILQAIALITKIWTNMDSSNICICWKNRSH